MEERRQDLDAVRQKNLLEQMVIELSREHADLYYKSTVDIARALRDYIKHEAILNQEERALLKSLNSREIQLRLSLH